MDPKEIAVSGREDLSRFIVHLTRDDSAPGKSDRTARANLVSIITSKNILATNPHSLFNERIIPLRKERRDRFNVCCFTEIPLSQIHLLVRPLPGRQVKLEPYGVVFTKEFMISKKAQPALYISSYNQNNWLREGVDSLWAYAMEGQQEMAWRLFPFLNAMHEKYDFSWEREWRVLGNLSFTAGDIVCVILPENDEKFRMAATEFGVPAIAPGWSYEKIIMELSKQQKRTKMLVTDQTQSSEKKQK